MKRERVWSLRSHLSALLMVTMLLTFVVVSCLVASWRVPAIERESQIELVGEIEELNARLELQLGTRRSRLEVLARLVEGVPDQQASAVMSSAMSGGQLFSAVYLVSVDGRVLAAGLPDEGRVHREDLVGSDLSANALYLAAQTPRQTVWSGKYLSALSGTVTVGAAYRTEGGRVLIGEVPMPHVLRAVQMAAGQRASVLVWLTDRSGEVLADTKNGKYVGKLNLRTWPLLQAMLAGQPPPREFRFEHQRFHATAQHAETLDWYVLGGAPAGFDNPAVQNVAVFMFITFLGSLVVGLLIAPFWANRMSRPLQEIVQRAALTTAGRAQDQSWPRGSVAEFNRLSSDLETMAHTLQEREQKFLAIFNATPIPMGVVDLDNESRYQDVNEAWCRDLMRPRESVVGRTAVEVGLWTPEARSRLMSMSDGDRISGEAVFARGDGQPMQVQVFGRRADMPTRSLMIWASVDMGPMRRIEQELREFNRELEARVEHRTQALAASNEELRHTVEQLRTAQAELVRSEKMAALGNLVAGVSHELNTPLGNGVMAISAMSDAMRRFTAAMQGGLKRTDLQQLLDSMQQGTDIAGRNLRRAADLVQSFKQVAVDQTSSQRRSFELGEIVHEMVVSLRPSFSRTPYQIDVQVPASGLRLDSYPGALGQAIGNLIQNAVIHGFDGRDHGVVCITAEPVGDDRIVLRVADDGRGIAAANLERIFEPFMTTKMGSGGTGLGLHISYNAVVSLLGGTLTVHSEEGQGAVFEMRLPRQAPRSAPNPAPLEAAGLNVA